MKKTRICAALLALILLFTGCRLGPSNPDSGGGPAIADPTTEPATAPTTEPVTVPTEPATVPTEPVEVGIHDGHKPGDQFPMTILLEGMEEPVIAQHYVDRKSVYCIDYFYEDFTLEEQREGEALLWKAPEGTPLSYMCITVTPGLTAKDQSGLICARMNASAEETSVAGFNTLAVSGPVGDMYVTYYLFDTAKGCVEVEMSCAVEALEGIGARMRAMVETFEILP